MSALYMPSGISAARLRMEAAGRAFAQENRDAKRKRLCLKGTCQQRRWEVRSRHKRDVLRKIAAERAMERAAYRAEKLLHETRLQPSMEALVVSVCAARGVPIGMVMGEARGKLASHARHEIFWHLRGSLGLTTAHIGRFFRRDHTTVVHGFAAHERRMMKAAQ